MAEEQFVTTILLKRRSGCLACWTNPVPLSTQILFLHIVGKNNYFIPPPIPEKVACKHMGTGEDKAVSALIQTIICVPVFHAD